MEKKEYKWAEEWLMYPDYPSNCKSEEERIKRHMKNDPNIKPDFYLPPAIRDLMEALDECYEIGAWYSWDNILGLFEAHLKSAVIAGEMSEKHYHLLLSKYE